MTKGVHIPKLSTRETLAGLALSLSHRYRVKDSDNVGLIRLERAKARKVKKTTVFQVDPGSKVEAVEFPESYRWVVEVCLNRLMHHHAQLYLKAQEGDIGEMLLIEVRRWLGYHNRLINDYKIIRTLFKEAFHAFKAHNMHTCWRSPVLDGYLAQLWLSRQDNLIGKAANPNSHQQTAKALVKSIDVLHGLDWKTFKDESHYSDIYSEQSTDWDEAFVYIDEPLDFSCYEKRGSHEVEEAQASEDDSPESKEMDDRMREGPMSSLSDATPHLAPSPLILPVLETEDRQGREDTGPMSVGGSTSPSAPSPSILPVLETEDRQGSEDTRPMSVGGSTSHPAPSPLLPVQALEDRDTEHMSIDGLTSPPDPLPVHTDNAAARWAARVREICLRLKNGGSTLSSYGLAYLANTLAEAQGVC
ncbi:predicted protein [Postia placenta Mad-698-R]|nr:predicted protein [Postia placenta Mad-698-R]